MIIEVDLANYIGLGLIVIGMSIFTLLFLWLAFKMRTLCDRYRLKYGFDREIESKEFGNDTEKMDRREKYFKKRVFKD